jgi:hypothetical protein
MSAAANAGMAHASFPLAVAGVFVGFGAGLRLVFTRFRDL